MQALIGRSLLSCEQTFEECNNSKGEHERYEQSGDVGQVELQKWLVTIVNELSRIDVEFLLAWL